MTTQTHTQGPWTTYIKGGADGWIAAADGNLIACAVRNESMQANARLIAAAPDLLAALDAVIEDLEGNIDCGVDGGATREWLEDATNRLNAARAAIAKAKGN
jgi:hypothetical protein